MGHRERRILPPVPSRWYVTNAKHLQSSRAIEPIGHHADHALHGTVRNQHRRVHAVYRQHWNGGDNLPNCHPPRWRVDCDLAVPRLRRSDCRERFRPSHARPIARHHRCGERLRGQCQSRVQPVRLGDYMSLRRATNAGSLTGRSVKTLGGPLVNGLRTCITTQLALGFYGGTSGAANTPGPYVQAIASTSEESGLLVIANVGANIGADNGFMLDVATGAAGSETNILSNLAIGMPNEFSFPLLFYIPVRIPAASRLSYRCRAGIASRSAFPTFSLFRFPSQHLIPTSVDVLGSSASTSHGTALSGASGTYTQIVDSTTKSYQAITIIPSSATNVGINGSFRLTLAVGPAGSESDIATLDASQGGSGAFIRPLSGHPMQPIPHGLHVPVGSRLSIKHNIAANPQYVEVCLVGVPL